MNSRIIWSCESGAIESVFSEQDRAKYSISKNNKVTSSYNFYNKVINKEIKKEDLEQETINNIKKIIDNLG